MVSQMSEIAFKRKRYLNDREFKNFLDLIKKIARYDPSRQEWVFSPEKARNNVSNKDELDQILAALSKYVVLSLDTRKRIITLFEESRKTITLDVDTFSFTADLNDEVLDELEDYIVKIGGRYIVKSIKYLPTIREILQKHGYILVYDEDLVKRKIEEKLVAVIRRKDGMLIVDFPQYIDVEAVKALRKTCKLRYYEERVMLDEEGNYVDTEYVPREIDTLKLSFREKRAITFVGLIDAVVESLKKSGYRIVLHIREKEKIDFDLKAKFKLMPHQERAFKLWIQRKRGTIAIFTRGGKSFIALKAIHELRVPTLILVTTRELAYTWRKYLVEYLGIPEARIGYLGEGKRYITPITIATYNSAVKYLSEIKDKFELLIPDEVHHVPARTFKNIALYVDALYRLGLSATPTRRDGNHELLYAIIGKLLITVDYEELIKLKVVAPIEIYETVFAKGKQEKIRKLMEILEKHIDEKIFIFTLYLETAEHIYNELLKNGFKAVLITGKTPSSKRKLAFRQFLSGQCNIMVSTTVLDEGITVPDAEVAVIFENTGEARQLIQRIGRVLNYKPGKTAKIYEIIDITNPREKYTYFKRKWVRDLYLFEGLEKYVQEEKAKRIYRKFIDEKWE
ncbi:MAG: hypothetical protein DRJ44_00045 [Thermoprotei archaeon]|nr:MAG: hypothetical protein DRJ44_00045 [Thermoprotei archaeon]